MNHYTMSVSMSQIDLLKNYSYSIKKKLLKTTIRIIISYLKPYNSGQTNTIK